MYRMTSSSRDEAAHESVGNCGGAPAPPFRVELATERDVPRMLEISNWAAENTTANFATQPESIEPWLETWRRTSPHHPWFVARSDRGEVLGFAKSSPHRSRAAYDWTAELSVYIAPDHQSRGVGTKLYRTLLPQLEAQGYVTLLAGITSGHMPSERLHAKMGFTRCATFHRVGWKFDRWCDVGWWELHLQAAPHGPRPLRAVADVLRPTGA
jgi:L-amino acid N-acyltransferase YncA